MDKNKRLTVWLPVIIAASIAQSCRERNHLPLDLERTPSFIMCMLVILSFSLYSFLCERTRSIFMSDMKKQIFDLPYHS